MDDAQLAVHPVLNLLGVECIAVETAQPGLGQVAQVSFGRVASRDLDLGQVKARGIEIDVTPLGDDQGVAQRLGQVGKQSSHLCRAFQVVAVVIHPEPRRISHGLAGLNAQQHFMGMSLVTPHIVGIVGSHQRDPHLAAHLHQRAVDCPHLGNVVVLELQEKAVGPKDVAIPLGGLASALGAVILQQAWHFS